MRVDHVDDILKELKELKTKNKDMENSIERDEDKTSSGKIDHLLEVLTGEDRKFLLQMDSRMNKKVGPYPVKYEIDRRARLLKIQDKENK